MLDSRYIGSPGGLTFSYYILVQLAQWMSPIGLNTLGAYQNRPLELTAFVEVKRTAETFTRVPSLNIFICDTSRLGKNARVWPLA